MREKDIKMRSSPKLSFTATWLATKEEKIRVTSSLKAGFLFLSPHIFPHTCIIVFCIRHAGGYYIKMTLTTLTQYSIFYSVAIFFYFLSAYLLICPMPKIQNLKENLLVPGMPLRKYQNSWNFAWIKIFDIFQKIYAIFYYYYYYFCLI